LHLYHEPLLNFNAAPTAKSTARSISARLAQLSNLENTLQGTNLL
jgi:hypothetical protein